MAKHGFFWAAQPDKTLFNWHYQNVPVRPASGRLSRMSCPFPPPSSPKRWPSALLSRTLVLPSLLDALGLGLGLGLGLRRGLGVGLAAGLELDFLLGRDDSLAVGLDLNFGRPDDGDPGSDPADEQVLASRVTSSGLGARGSGQRGGMHGGLHVDDFPRAVGRVRGLGDGVKSSGWIPIVGVCGWTGGWVASDGRDACLLSWGPSRKLEDEKLCRVVLCKGGGFSCHYIPDAIAHAGSRRHPVRWH